MTNILVIQSEIKSRHHPKSTPTRHRGKFVNPAKAIQAKIDAERFNARLLSDTEAMEHADGYVFVKKHIRPFPGAKLHTLESPSPHIGETVPLPSLFERVAA